MPVSRVQLFCPVLLQAQPSCPSISNLLVSCVKAKYIYADVRESHNTRGNKASQNVSAFSEKKTKAKWPKDIFQILNIVIEIQGL